MKVNRREYRISVVVNGIKITKVIIDPHYELKHSKTMNDKLILELVQSLDGQFFPPEDEKAPFKYFAKDDIVLRNKVYKLVWLIEEHQIYIGVVNAHRRK